MVFVLEAIGRWNERSISPIFFFSKSSSRITVCPFFSYTWAFRAWWFPAERASGIITRWIGRVESSASVVALARVIEISVPSRICGISSWGIQSNTCVSFHFSNSLLRFLLSVPRESIHSVSGKFFFWSKSVWKIFLDPWLPQLTKICFLSVFHSMGIFVKCELCVQISVSSFTVLFSVRFIAVLDFHDKFHHFSRDPESFRVRAGFFSKNCGWRICPMTVVLSFGKYFRASSNPRNICVANRPRILLENPGTVSDSWI